MNAREAAERLAVTGVMVAKWCRRGLIGVRNGREWQITEADLRRFEAHHKRASVQRTAYLPSEEEIEQACCDIREGWSDREEQARVRVDWRREAAVVQHVPGEMHQGFYGDED